MEIQHQNNARRHQQKISFQEMYEYDNDLVQQLVKIIDSMFQPLTWILEETLFRRIKKQDKGWIDIDYLNRNPKIKQIFKSNGVPPQTRRKRNLLLRAIKMSILKKKKNLVKRKNYLNVNIELKKVIYFQAREVQSKLQIGEVQNIDVQSQQKNFPIELTKSNLASIITRISQQLAIKQNYFIPEYQQLIKMEAQQGENKNVGHNENLVNQMQFYGKFCQDSSTRLKANNQNSISTDQQQVIQKEESYRWCFVYLPYIEMQQIQIIKKALKKVFYLASLKNSSLSQEMNLLNITQGFQNQSQTSNNVEIHTLKQMIHKYYPIYQQISKQIGYKKQDIRQERLRIRRKQKRNQRDRLLESVNLEKKIDVVNQYHVKLQVEKQRKAFLKKKQSQYEKKMRLREQRKNNKSKYKTDESDQKIDTYTLKIRQLLGLSNQEEKPQIAKVQEKLKVQKEKEKDQIQNPQFKKVEQETQQKASNIQIKLPKYNEIQVEDKNINIVNENNEIYESFFENQQEEMSSQSSSEDYEASNKRLKKKADSHKKKKITKSSQKDTKVIKSTYKQVNIHISKQKFSQQKLNSQKNTSNSHSNSAYNLRHKAPVHGSYLKMVQLHEQGDNTEQNKKLRHDKFSKKFQTVIDQANEVSTRRSLRVRKQNDQQI